MANINDVPNGVVTVFGTAKQGEILSADTSNLSDADGLGSFIYQWQADGTDIRNANSSTYTLSQAEVDKAVSVNVSYLDDLGSAESITSLATSTVTNTNDDPTGIVTITGIVAEGEVLTVNTSNLSDSDGLGALSYQWQADGIDISNANSSNYTLTEAELGKALTVALS